jgi:hypothetical protein
MANEAPGFSAADEWTAWASSKGGGATGENSKAAGLEG